MTKEAKKQVYREVGQHIGVSLKTAKKIVDKAIKGGEITDSFGAERWFEERFRPNIVYIDESGYTRMCVSALRIVMSTAPTDFGSSRQRDLGQLWADMTRGYLGELAFKKFLADRWGIEVGLDHAKGELENFLPRDVCQIKDGDSEDGSFREVESEVSVKTTKWNGIWLDVPGAQFNHSDAQVLVKVGTGRDHLFAYFKQISVFRDKVLQRGVSEGSLSRDEAEELFDDLPDFGAIPSYICGFVMRDDYLNKEPVYGGRMGRKHYTIDQWAGIYKVEMLETIKREYEVPGRVKFQAIGSFSHDNAYIFNTGNLRWKSEDWQLLIRGL